MDYSRIKLEVDHKEMTIKDLCCRIGVTEQGLHQMIRKESMKVEILERISSVLELPVTYWFEGCLAASCDINMIPNVDIEVVTNVKKRKRKKDNLILKKIELLTNELNRMLKELVYR